MSMHTDVYDASHGVDCTRGRVVLAAAAMAAVLDLFVAGQYSSALHRHPSVICQLAGRRASTRSVDHA